MMAQRERLVLDAKALDRALTRITHEILERNRDTSDLVLIGIRSRGVDLAARLAAKISASKRFSCKRNHRRPALSRRLTRATSIQVRHRHRAPLDDRRVILVDA
jgi:pyrimidine operon attenuation protein/uracil phosphoribosyltransferase